ncbi:HET domain containing protein [Hyaloscypha variabilis]
MVQFYYEPLPLETHKDRIRVMELFPGDGDSPIECSIREESLSDTPDYEALSYRWGNLKTPQRISMQGKDFEITQNLYTALRHLRYAKQKRTLWIDAICIDQMGVREKNHQVQLMRDIYKKARRTLIWLGRGTEKIRQGFAIIPKLIHASKEKWSMTECMLDWELISNLPSLWAILENPYFARVWIVQEIVFSADQLVVCGGLTVSWRDFSAAIVYSRQAGIALPLGQPSSLNFWSIRSSVMDLANHFDRGFLNLLLRFRSFHATDPRDKVYALLGLTTVVGQGGRQIQIQPDFDPRLSAEDIFISSALAIIRASRNLDIFSVPRAATPSQLKLPSWVPDWTVEELTSSLLLPDENMRDKYCFFATRPSSQAEPRLRPDGAAFGLGLRGQLIDCVQEVGTVFLKPIFLSSSMLEQGRLSSLLSGLNFFVDTLYGRARNGLTMLNWESITEANSGELYITGEPILDVFWQTFLGGSAHSGPGDRWKKQRASWQRILIGYNYPCYLGLHYSTTIYVVAIFVFECFRQLYIVLALFGQFGFAKQVEGNTDTSVARNPVHENRKMFKTENGYIGLGPRDMEAGDRIALFSGGSMPLVMRTKGTGLELIGDCYVHGIMYSERYREDQCELLWIV